MRKRQRHFASEEDIARAEKRSRERRHNLSIVRDSISEKFSSLCKLDNVIVLPEGDFEFRVIVFFKEDKDIEEYKNNGICQSIEDFAYNEIERVGRGKRKEVTIAFEFDSDENMRVKYNRNYWKRLH